MIADLTILRYYEAQVAIGEAIQGWVYWTWKASIFYRGSGRSLMLLPARLRVRTIGAIRKDWKEAGYLKIRRTECIPIFARTTDVQVIILWTSQGHMFGAS